FLCTKDSEITANPFVINIIDNTFKIKVNSDISKKVAINEDIKKIPIINKKLNNTLIRKHDLICKSLSLGCCIMAGPTTINEKMVVNVITTIAALTTPKS